MRRDPAAPVALTIGQGVIAYADPYTGRLLGRGDPGVRAFFRERHRLAPLAGGERRISDDAAAPSPAPSNLAFLFLVLSGAYLWIPRTWAWRAVKQVIWFRGGLPGKARDFNWHNTIGVWSVVPLAIVVASGVGHLVSLGEQPGLPDRRRSAAGAAPARRKAVRPAGRTNRDRPAPQRRESRGAVAAALSAALDHGHSPTVPTWRTITLRLPATPAPTLAFTIDDGGPGQPQHRGTLTVDRASGAVAKWEGFDGRHARPPAPHAAALRPHRRGARPARPVRRRSRLARRRRPRLHRLRLVLSPLRCLARPSPPSGRRSAARPGRRLIRPFTSVRPSVPVRPTIMKTRSDVRAARPRPAVHVPPLGHRRRLRRVGRARRPRLRRLGPAAARVPRPRRRPAAGRVAARRPPRRLRRDNRAGRRPRRRSAAGGHPVRHSAGPLSAVIKAFEAVTGYTVTLADPALGDIASPGVAGVITVDKAIAAILSGTGVSARESGLRQLTLSLGGVSESLDVTATARVASVRYARPVAETPQTIQVIPRQVMEAQGVTTLSEALRNVPGISLQAGEGGGASSTTGDMFNLRGFSANNSLFVDGVRDDGLIARDVFNLEQVEVFLGPTGTDVGRGNAAGYVNMTTKTPGRAEPLRRHGDARHLRSAPRVDRPQPGRAGRRQGVVAGRHGAPPERPQAGQRRPRPRRSPTAQPGGRALARARPRHAHARRRRRPVHRAGQRAGLRHPRRARGRNRGWRRRRCTPRGPVDQSNFYGTPDRRLRPGRRRTARSPASSTTCSRRCS